MKIIVTHSSPDLDAIVSAWLIKKFLPGWENASLQFVPAGDRYKNAKVKESSLDSKNPVEVIGEDEVIHVDTGLGVLDHHDTSNMDISAASLTWEYVKSKNPEFGEKISERTAKRKEAITRMVQITVDIDHFQEVYWDNPTADFHEFSLIGIIEGLKFQKPGQDEYYIEFIGSCLDALLHDFENRVWAEEEISKKGIEFKTKWGKGFGIETINDEVMKLGQKMGYMVVVRKDPRKAYVRIKARPVSKYGNVDSKLKKEVDLTQVYEKLKKMDPEATWYLHPSKKMLLNGTTKNPKMKPSSLSLNDIIKAIESI